MAHKLEKKVDNNKPVTYLLFCRGGHIFSSNEFLVISPVSLDCKRCANTGPNSVASSFKTLGYSPSV